MNLRRPQLNKRRNPGESPAYSLAEAAHYLQVPRATISSWVRGRHYPVRGGTKFFKPVIELPDASRSVLSFINLVEVHVLDAIRRKHAIPLDKVRAAVRYLERHFDSRHPLADQRIETDGRDLFVQKLGQLITISQEGQLAMRTLLDAHLRRIEWDPSGVAARLYLFARKRALDEPRVVVVDPAVSFGRPVLVGTGIPTAVIASRFKAGETIEQLADDYGRNASEIHDAIRCELPEAA